MSFVRVAVTWRDLPVPVVASIVPEHVQYVSDGKVSMASGKTLDLADPDEEAALVWALHEVINGGDPMSLPSAGEE